MTWATQRLATQVVALVVLAFPAPADALAMPAFDHLSPPTSTTTLHSTYDETADRVRALVDGNVDTTSSSRSGAATSRPAVALAGSLRAPQAIARGGAGPVRQGAAGVNRTVAEIEASGGRVLGREITVDVGGVRTRPDLFVELPSGQRAFIEVKTGAGAGLTANQLTAFLQIIQHGRHPGGRQRRSGGFDA